MASPYPTIAKQIVPGASKDNVVTVDVTALDGFYIGGLYILMGSEATNRPAADMTKYRYNIAVSVQFDGVFEATMRNEFREVPPMIGLGSVQVDPLLQGIELVAVVCFPDQFSSWDNPSVNLMKYEVAFSSEQDLGSLVALAWVVPLLDVPFYASVGVHNVQTRRFGPGDVHSNNIGKQWR